MALYNTSGGDDINYIGQNENVTQQTGIPPDPPVRNPYAFSTTIGNPRKGIVSTPSKGEYSISQEDWDRYAEGFSGTSPEELQKYRVDTQSEFNKGFNAIAGGLLSGIGTFIEDVGYIADIDTYRSMFGDIDYSANKSLGLLDYMPSQLLSSGLQKLGESIKGGVSENMPIYENQGKSVASQVFNWNALKGTIDSIAGFALTGWGAGAAVKGVSKMGIQGLADLGKFSEALVQANKVKNIPSVVSRLAEVGSKLKRTESYVELLATKYPAINELGPLATSVLTKGAEARMEGLDSYNTAMSQLNPLVLDGTISREEAIQEANKAANHAFDMTMITFAGDALMLRKMFTPKANLIAEKIMKPGLRSTAIDAGKNLVLGAPKEGLEEMWQQKAQMEGVYDIYNDIKGKLSKTQKEAYKQQAGFDPERTPSDFVSRSIDMMTSTQAQVAGILGAIAGPFQSSLVGSVGRKERNKKQLEDYNRQQEVYKNNEALFNASNQFIEQVNVTASSKTMQDLALSAGNDKMLEFAKEQTFLNIAAKNFATGTHDQLREVLKANPGIESTKFLKDLDSMEDDFVASKKFVNAEEIFLNKRNTLLHQKQLNILLDEANNENLEDKVRKEYSKGVERVKQEISKLDSEYKQMTSTSHQLDLIDEAKSYGKLMSIYASLPEMNSLYQLEQLQKEYPKDIAIAERLKTLKEEKSVKLAEPNKANVTNTKSVTEEKIKQLKTSYKDKSLSQLIAEKEKVTKTNKEFKQETLDVLDELIQERKQPETGVGNNTNGVPILSKQQLREELTNFFSIGSKEDKLEASIIPSKADYEQFEELYNEVKDKHTSLIDRQKDLINTAIKLYQGRKETTSEEVNTVTGISDASKQSAKDLFEALSLDTLESEDLPETIDPNMKQNMQAILAELLDKLHTSALVNDNIDIYGDFKTYINFLNNIDPVLTKQHYNRLAGLYIAATGSFNGVSQSYNEAFNITTPDFVDDGDMPTEHKLKQVLNFPAKYVSPDTNSEELMNIFMNEEVVSLDKLNEMPASSMAYLSQAYVYETVGNKQVKRKSSINDKVKGDNILNPNKFNSGDQVNLSIDEDYDDVVTLSTGLKINFKELKENADSEGNFNKEFYAKHNLGKQGYYETLYDYQPIKIHTDIDGTVAYVHDTAWINKLTTATDTIKDSRELLKNFRKRLITHLKSNENKPVITTVLGKAIGLTKDGSFRGGVINKKSIKQNTAKAFPDKSIIFADKSTGGLNANGNKVATDNVINGEKLVDIHNNIIFSLMPLGKQNGVMQYWAETIYNNRLTKGQAKTVRQALEIFVTQDSSINQELYDKYLNHPIEKIDLKTNSGLDKFLKKLVYLYHRKDMSIDEFIKSKSATNPVPVMTLDGQTIKIGKGSLQVIEKGKNISKEKWDLIESKVLGEMLFNISKNTLNTRKDFHYTGLNDNGVVETFEGSYNEFMKPNTSTLGNSTLLNDGSYGYVIQPVTRFDMMIKELEQPIVEQKQEVQQVSTEKLDYSKRPEVIKALQDLSLTYEEFYSKYLQKIESGKVTYEQIMSAVNKLVESKKNNEEQTKCTN